MNRKITLPQMGEKEIQQVAGAMVAAEKVTDQAIDLIANNAGSTGIQGD